MKNIILAAIISIFSLNIINAAPVQDTIKILSGDKTIIIVSKGEKSDMSDLEFGKKTFENKIEKYQKSIDSLDNIIDSLTGQLDGANDSVAALLQKHIDEMKAQQQEYQKMIDALEKGIKDIEKQMESMEKEENDTQKYAYNDNENNQEKITKKKSSRKFKGHWAGLEFGPNSFLTPDRKLINNTRSPLAPTFNKSFEFSFNFLEGNIKIFNFLGIVSGLGLQWNNYKYETFPTYSADYVLNTDSLYPPTNAAGNTLKQISMKTFFINVPLLVELQIPFGGSNKFYINVGGYAGINIHSKLKFVYDQSGNTIKFKESIDKMVLPYHYGLTARIGIDQIQLYANYSLTTVFRNSQNPELYPVSAGMRINF